MPVPPSETQWAINLGTIAAGAIAALGAWIWKRFEQRKPEPAAPGLAIVGGALLDGRTIEGLADNIDDLTRAVRDLDRTNHDLINEMRRSNDALAEARRALEARHKAQAASDDALVQAIQLSRVNANRPTPD